MSDRILILVTGSSAVAQLCRDLSVPHLGEAMADSFAVRVTGDTPPGASPVMVRDNTARVMFQLQIGTVDELVGLYRDQLERLAAAMDESPLARFEIDRDRVSSEASRLFGYQPGEAKTLPLPGEDHRAVVEARVRHAECLKLCLGGGPGEDKDKG